VRRAIDHAEAADADAFVYPKTPIEDRAEKGISNLDPRVLTGVALVSDDTQYTGSFGYRARR
jgi:hypothetical protein